MEFLGEIVAGPAQGFRFEKLEGLINPLTASGADSQFAFVAPSVWPWIVRIFDSPKKTYPPPIGKSRGDVLANPCLLLKTMNVTVESFPHCFVFRRRT